jgi:hypothetical protein
MSTPLYLKQHYSKRHQLGDLRLSTLNDEWDWNPFTDDTDNNGNLRRAVYYVPLNDANSAYVIPQLRQFESGGELSRDAVQRLRVGLPYSRADVRL